METLIKWAGWLVPLLGVAGAGVMVLSYLNGAWLDLALGALMLAAYLMIMSALSRRSRQPVRLHTKAKTEAETKTKTKHRKH